MIRVMVLIMSLAISFGAMSQERSGLGRIVDGDTLWVDGQKFRIFGIDAPESKQVCGEQDAQWACGQAATQVLQELTSGSRVTCVPTGDRSYDRLVASCYTNDVDLGEAMVARGMAEAAVSFSTRYLATQNVAKSQGIGVWRDDSFQSPSDYRHGGNRDSNSSSVVGALVGSLLGMTTQTARSEKNSSIHDSPLYHSIESIGPVRRENRNTSRISSSKSSDWDWLFSNSGQKGLSREQLCSFAKMNGKSCN